MTNYRLPEYNWMSSEEANQWYYDQGKISKKTRDFYNDRTIEFKILHHQQSNKVAELQNIPFYKINFDVDHNKIKEELDSVLHMKQDIKRGSTKGWFSIALYDVIDNTADSTMLHSGVKEDFHIDYHNDGSPVWKVTDAGKFCPYTIESVLKMTDSPNRIHFRSLPPESVVRWHTHVKLPQIANTIKKQELYHEFPVHIPTITNKYCYAMVGDTEEFIHSKEDYTVENFVGKHFPLGEVWGLNSAKNHQVWNGGDEERWHLFFYTNFLGYENTNKFTRFL
jgi:hypothetical protein